MKKGSNIPATEKGSVRNDKPQTAKGGNTKTNGGNTSNRQQGKSAQSNTFSVFDEIFTYAEAASIARGDACKLSSKPEAFVKANQFQYYLALNTWAMIWIPERNYSKEVIFRNWLRNEGLVACIGYCAICADELVSAVDDSGYAANVRYVLHDPGSDTRNIVNAILAEEVLEDPSAILQALRFLKRFTPKVADKLEQQTADQFRGILLETNWRLYSASVSRDPDVTPPEIGWLGKIVRKYLSTLLRSFSKNYEGSCGKFSSGVCLDGKNLVEKLAAYAKCRPYLDTGLHPLNNGIRKYAKSNLGGEVADGEYLDTFSKKGKVRELFTPIVRMVPKNYKSYRTIAPESSYVAFEMQRVRAALVKCMEQNGYKRCFDVSTQEPNRLEAWASSYTGLCITVDLSSASDREARHVMKQLLPDDVWETILPFLPVAIKVDGKNYAPSIFLTSGNPATFMFLGILILAIALAARELHWRYTREWLPAPVVFGDDGVIPGGYSEEFFTILEHLGLKVNYEKTFMNHYRESCGVEYADGYPMTTDFWPRKTVEDPRATKSADDILTLTALQHRIFGYGRPADFIYNCVRLIYPSMTESYVGTDCIDLWSLFPHKGKIVKAPIQITRDDQLFCNIERRLKGESIPPVPERAVQLGYVDREVHITSLTEPNELTRKLGYDGWEALEQYLFYRFLVEGPSYEENDSSVAKVSEKPPKKELLAYRPVTRLAPKRR